MCLAGVCAPVPAVNARVVLDLSTRHQTLVGLGATVGYAEDELVNHPQKAALYSAMFEDLGLDLLRLRNRAADASPGLAATNEIIDAAAAGIGRAPTLLLTSWSPPATLKQSGATNCQGNADTCTLSRTPAGAFDYPGFDIPTPRLQR